MTLSRLAIVVTTCALVVLAFGSTQAAANHEGCRLALGAPIKVSGPIWRVLVGVDRCRGVASSTATVTGYEWGFPIGHQYFNGGPVIWTNAYFGCSPGTHQYFASGWFTIFGGGRSGSAAFYGQARMLGCNANRMAPVPYYDAGGTAYDEVYLNH